jgi:hypothetical protein
MSFLEIFQPGLRHLREERARQRMDVAHPTNGADPLMVIDLDAGTATVVVPVPTSPEAADPSQALPAAEPSETAGDSDPG